MPPVSLSPSCLLVVVFVTVQVHHSSLLRSKGRQYQPCDKLTFSLPGWTLAPSSKVQKRVFEHGTVFFFPPWPFVMRAHTKTLLNHYHSSTDLRPMLGLVRSGFTSAFNSTVYDWLSWFKHGTAGGAVTWHTRRNALKTGKLTLK